MPTSIPNSGILQLSPAAYPGSSITPLDLTPYLNVQSGAGMDVANPQFTSRVWSHALLKEGGVQALEQFQVKELAFPVLLIGQGTLQQNFVPNPSFEYDVAGNAPAAWVTSVASLLTTGSTLTVTASQQESGLQGLQIVTTSTTHEGAAIQLINPAGGSFLDGVTYTFSVWLKGNAGGESAQLVLGVSGDSATAAASLTTSWQRFDVVWTPSSNEVTPYAVIRSNAASAYTFFADAAQVTVGSGLSTYFDGDTPQYYWTAAPGDSMAQNYYQRDGAALLLQQINTMLNAAGQTVLWQDQGSSQPTYFDVAAGEVDIAYDFRRASAYLLQGNMRIFVQPLGHTATMRLIASAAGTGPLLQLPIASPILGDAPALIQAQIQGGTSGNVAAWDTAALSVIPNGYVPEYQASALSPGASTTLVGGSGAVASLVRRQAVSGQAPGMLFGVGTISASSLLTTLNLYAATPYRGINRLFGVVRATAGLSQPTTLGVSFDNLNAWLQAQYLFGNGATQAFFGPTTAYISNASAALEAPAGWSVVDLGVVSVPSSLPAATLAIQLWASYNVVWGGSGVSATFTLDITDAILLPDGQTTFWGQGGQVKRTWTLDADGINSESYVSDASNTVLQYRQTGLQRGAIPKVPVGASSSIVALLLPSPGTSALPLLPANDTISASVTVRERTRFSF